MYYSQTKINTGLDTLRAPLRAPPIQRSGCREAWLWGACSIAGIPEVWGRNTLLSGCPEQVVLHNCHFSGF